MISRALVTLARAILPVYNSTPTTAILREALLKPAHTLLKETRLHSALRLAAADPFHPLAKKYNDAQAHTRLTEKL